MLLFFQFKWHPSHNKDHHHQSQLRPRRPSSLTKEEEETIGCSKQVRGVVVSAQYKLGVWWFPLCAHAQLIVTQRPSSLTKEEKETIGCSKQVRGVVVSAQYP